MCETFIYKRRETTGDIRNSPVFFFKIQTLQISNSRIRDFQGIIFKRKNEHKERFSDLH